MKFKFLVLFLTVLSFGVVADDIIKVEDEPFKFDGPEDLSEDKVKAYRKICRVQSGGKSLSKLGKLYEKYKIDMVELAKSKVCPLRIARDRKIKFWNPLHVAIFYPLKTVTSVGFLLRYLKKKGREDLILNILNTKDERGRTMLDLVEERRKKPLILSRKKI